jgi:hypothetical protein
MAISFAPNSLSLGFVAPKSKPLLVLHRPPHLLPAALSSKSSISPRFSANRIPRRHLRHSSPPGSGTTLLEDQSQSQSEEKEADASTEVASELKQMQRERTERERQWSDMGKVVGATGVVLAVLAGSTAAFLSVNAILAELSDKVFDGRIRIQDFF